MSEEPKKRRDLDPVKAVKEVKQMMIVFALLLGALPIILVYFLKALPVVLLIGGGIWLGRVIKHRSTRL